MERAQHALGAHRALAAPIAMIAGAPHARAQTDREVTSFGRNPIERKKGRKRGSREQEKEIHYRSRGCVVQVRDRATTAWDRDGRRPASLEKNWSREREEGARDEETKSEAALEEAAKEQRDRETGGMESEERRAADGARRDGTGGGRQRCERQHRLCLNSRYSACRSRYGPGYGERVVAAHACVSVFFQASSVSCRICLVSEDANQPFSNPISSLVLYRL